MNNVDSGNKAFETVVGALLKYYFSKGKGTEERNEILSEMGRIMTELREAKDSEEEDDVVTRAIARTFEGDEEDECVGPESSQVPYTCSECGDTNHHGGGVVHLHDCSNAVKCSHCYVRTDLDPVQHKFGCPLVDKCEECGDCLMPGERQHLFKCSKTPKCKHCNQRLDYVPVRHLYDCPKANKCRSCGVRVDFGDRHKRDCLTQSQPKFDFEAEVERNFRMNYVPMCETLTAWKNSRQQRFDCTAGELIVDRTLSVTQCYGSFLIPVLNRTSDSTQTMVKFTLAFGTVSALPSEMPKGVRKVACEGRGQWLVYGAKGNFCFPNPFSSILVRSESAQECYLQALRVHRSFELTTASPFHLHWGRKIAELACGRMDADRLSRLLQK
jgi:hypothetical protein